MFLPHYTEIVAPNASPSSWMLVLHGIFGRGGNWRSFARKLVQGKPTLGAVLVDLRMHGDSQGAAGPHTVADAAADLVALTAELATQGRAVSMVCGHSFGGKVALAYRQQVHQMQTWVLDSSPSPNEAALMDSNNVVASVLGVLEQLPTDFSNRGSFVQELSGRGLAPSVAQWLAMNLDPVGSAYRFRLDLGALRELLTDYYHTDLWASVQASEHGDLHFVRAGRSAVLAAGDWRRLQQMPAHVHLHTIAHAGHWLHVDALSDLVEIVAGAS